MCPETSSLKLRMISGSTNVVKMIGRRPSSFSTALMRRAVSIALSTESTNGMRVWW